MRDDVERKYLNTKKAHQRLESARRALRMLEGCKSFDEFELQWRDFLIHAKGVYTQLGTACAEDEQANAWYKHKISERKKDTLLQYVFQARNADDHTLEECTELTQGYIGYGDSSSEFRFQMDIDGSVTITPLNGTRVPVRKIPPRAQLLPVRDRGGNIYPTPTIHLGDELADISPVGVARACLAYLRDMVNEADVL